MSIKHARWALNDYVERLECDLEDEGMSWHQRERWQHLLDEARKGLAELDAVDVAERGLLASIAKECQTPVAESGEEER